MERTPYAARLRYLDADDLDNGDVDFDGLDVHATDGTSIGEVDGFLLDPGVGRALYIVVDSGGWFSSRRYLLPIGHAVVDRKAPALRVDVARENLRSYPDFDERTFPSLSDDDLRRFEHRMSAVCCPDDLAADADSWRFDGARHYQQPPWWPAAAYTKSRLREIAPASFRERRRTPRHGAVGSAG